MSSPLPVAILAGGLATRLRPITEKIPKLLVEVAGEPFFSHQIRLLKRHGLDHLVLCVRDLEAARAAYTHFGFTVTPRAVHPFGTGNSLVQLEGTYLELLTVVGT